MEPAPTGGSPFDHKKRGKQQDIPFKISEPGRPRSTIVSITDDGEVLFVRQGYFAACKQQTFAPSRKIRRGDSPRRKARQGLWRGGRV